MDVVVDAAVLAVYVHINGGVDHRVIERGVKHGFLVLSAFRLNDGEFLVPFGLSLGKKFFNDHKITSIQEYIDKNTLTKYDAIDVNVYQSNIFHTKMLIKDIDLQNYLFKKDVYELTPTQRLDITDALRREMIEIFSGMNIY